MKTIVIGFLLALGFLSSAWAQEIPYSRTDLLQKKRSAGMWKFTPIGEDVRIFKTVPASIPETEDITEWGRESKFAGLQTNIKEVFSKPLDLLAPGERGVGRMEISDSVTGEIVKAWPLIFDVHPASGAFVHIHFKIFMDDGAVYEITREFLRGYSQEILTEWRRVTDVHGVITSDVIDARMR
jgi:hypothetical protein